MQTYTYEFILNSLWIQTRNIIVSHISNMSSLPCFTDSSLHVRLSITLGFDQMQTDGGGF